MSRYFDVTYLLKFILLFVPLYIFNLIFIGLVTPVNRYSPFLDNHLNYVNWLRNSILFVSNGIAHIFGLNSHIQNAYSLKVENGTNLLVGVACLGLGVIIFWTSFILADGCAWRKKLSWWIGGLFVIWFINCIRVAVILLAFEKNWKAIINVDHHTVFNTFSYILILFMMFLFYRFGNRPETKKFSDAMHP